MKRSSTLIAFASAIMLAASISPVLAQTTGGGSHDDPRVEDPIVSLEFRGGTVGEYLDVIRRAAPEANILADDIARDATFFPVTLQSTSVDAAIELIQNRNFDGPDGRYLIAVSRIHGGSNVQPIYRLRASRLLLRDEKPEPLLSHVWSLSRLTGEDGLSSEMILSAVETALAMQEDLGEPQLRYHEDTQLLIARAHPVQIEMIENVIDTLEDSQVYRARQQAEAEQAVQLAIVKAKAEGEQFRVRSVDLQQQLLIVQQLLDKSEATVRALQAELEKLRMRLEQSKGRGDGASELP